METKERRGFGKKWKKTIAKKKQGAWVQAVTKTL
jgi:hypothetical protein